MSVACQFAIGCKDHFKKISVAVVGSSITTVLLYKLLLHMSRYIAFLTTLRKHAYSNILKILPPKNENFQIKKSDIFQISAQNIDCGYSSEPPRRGGSNEYSQSMF